MIIIKVSYPVHQPSALEMQLFDAGLVELVPLAEIYDIKARTSIQRLWQDPAVLARRPDIHDPEQWDDKLHASLRGEFFVEALRGSRKILDVGCGEGWPSLYLARSFPEVVGIDLSPEHIALARQTAILLSLHNVDFQVEEIENLPFEEEHIDGVCFGGNVFTYNRDPAQMLAELNRVLTPGGVFAFEQWPVDADRPAFERVQWFIDGGPPVLHFGAGIGLYDRSYFIYIQPQSEQGSLLLDLATRMNGEISEEQQASCQIILNQIESGKLEMVQGVIYSGESRSLAVDDFPWLLQDAGFHEITSWVLPDARIFAQALQEEGRLAKFQQEDLIPILRALVRSAQQIPGWEHTWVTCRKV
jgi:SAM-dependent methyltransferase